MNTYKCELFKISGVFCFIFFCFVALFFLCPIYTVGSATMHVFSAAICLVGVVFLALSTARSHRKKLLVWYVLGALLLYFTGLEYGVARCVDWMKETEVRCLQGAAESLSTGSLSDEWRIGGLRGVVCGLPPACLRKGGD